jgi:hypothetical protein
MRGNPLFRAMRHKAASDHRARMILVFPNGSWNTSHRLGYAQAVRKCHLLKGIAKGRDDVKRKQAFEEALNHMYNYDRAAECILDNRSMSMLVGDIYLDAIAPFYDFKAGVR